MGPRFVDDRGSVLILGIGLVVVCLLAIAVAVDASAAFLQRRALMAIGDAAALAGAQAIDLDAYYSNGATPGTRLAPGLVVQAAREHVTHAPAGSRVSIDAIVTDGTTVIVRLSSPLELPFFSAMATEPVRIESAARLDYRPSA